MNNCYLYSKEELTEAARLLLQMRDNCVPHDDDAYDDPQREAKYKSLTVAIYAVSDVIKDLDSLEPEMICSVTGQPCCECMPGGCKNLFQNKKNSVKIEDD